MKFLNSFLMLLTLASSLTFAASRREAFTEIRYFAFNGTGKGSSAADALPVVDNTCVFTLPAGSVVNRASVVVTAALAGTTLVSFGDSDVDGYVDSGDVTEATPGFYPGTGALIDTEIGVYYSSATCVQMDITTAATAGAYVLEVSGYRL